MPVLSKSKVYLLVRDIVTTRWNCFKKNKKNKYKLSLRDFRGGTVVENPPANAGDTGSIPGLGRSHMLRSN